MSDDSVSVLNPRHGTVGGEVSTSTGFSMTSMVIASATLALAVVTLLVFVVQDHREPSVINDETIWVAVAGTLVAALATGSAVLGRVLQPRRGSGAVWSYLALCVAVPLGAFLALAWLPHAA